MTITNGYCTLAQAKSLKRITSTDTDDDSEIEGMVEDASRLIDGITGKWFYAYTDTKYFDVPKGRELRFGNDYLLSVTTLTNGDGTTIASTQYDLLPKNAKPYYGLMLKANSSTYWQFSTTTLGELAISIAGSWGYVDRTATDPVSARIISNTKRACLSIFGAEYDARFGENKGGEAIVTGAGVVITPQGAVPKAAWKLISQYIRRV